MADQTDNAYPIWMENVSTSTDAGASRAGRSRTDSTLATISDILGWRVDTSDPAGIRRALSEAFTICHDPEGKTIVKHKPRGFRVQVAQSGIAAVTGAQRSLYERARNIVDQVYPLLDGLLPLKTDPDYEDVSAIRALIRPELEELVEQLG
ncbi:MAG TPA: hypothetical protein VN181_02460, partial [Thermoanaerobaculia bacterium]|nr:hypothetical protein [Thermoanaerobaculia bacterium]